MTLHQKIKDEIKTAMKAREGVKLRTLRGLVAAFTNELVAKKQKPDGELADAEALTVIHREARKRRESIESFEKGGRQDLVAGEQAELAVLTEYLPELMSKEEIRAFVTAKKNELGITDESKKGMLMGTVMKELTGRADGNLVKEIVDELLK
ncbi:GatB/YqeY domain-containing protein [Candidatus Wolfebacteria bacterium]|nr:GatB/YqeY domain-containing protein [Candidatus Wolfebacteria bacterium]